MADHRAALERLCRRFGIATDYHDIWGTRHAAPDANLIALLAAFDVDATSSAKVAAAAHEAELEHWREVLPPVAAIVAGDAAASVPLRLPAALRDGGVAWTIEEEGGAIHRGRSAADAHVVGARSEIAGTDVVECVLAPALALPAGYHRLRVDGVAGATLLVAAPARCWRPPALERKRRVFGPAVQLYALRSDDNWGIGDFSDLVRLVEQWGARGAGIVGLNPLHALFGHNPAHISPYSPSSRQRLNPIYIDVEAVAELRACDAAQRLVRSAGFQARLARLRASELIDHVGVAAAKGEVLRLLYAYFREHVLGDDVERARAFRAFQRAGGRELRCFALFEAVQAERHAADPAIWGWPVWPEAWHDPEAEPVVAFAATHLAEVEFHEYLQWLAEEQLARAAAQAKAIGMAVGLYLDLAVSVDRAGADAWSHADTYALGASVGAPPDEFNPQGQAWGLPPLRPDRLRASGYRIVVETLRATMRHAGALRIDHVMGLIRLFWIPPGKSARDGAYVHYRADELLAIVALESHRNRCMVIGEDLGTVLDEMRALLQARGVLSYRLLYFERSPDGAFKAPADYPRDALVAVSTHDLPTLAGWWHGRDIDWRRDLRLLGDDAANENRLRAARGDDRDRLLAWARDAGQRGASDDLADALMTPPLAETIQRTLATAPSAVMMVQLEDALGMAEQANLPGTTDEHPNWRRKLAADLDAMAADPRIDRLAAALAKARPPPAPARRAAPDPRLAPNVPRATYRLQLHHRFTFDDATRALPYLARLGISHVYCSPITRATRGSLHGYDVVAHDEINPELGGAAGFARFSAGLRKHGLGLLLDLVPNHMGIAGADNAWWADVLEDGEASLYARHFDIDWHPLDAALDGKVMLPVLGAPYGDVLASGELKLVFEAERGLFAVRYHEHRFPLAPASYPALLAAIAVEEPSLRPALEAIAALFDGLPAGGEADSDAGAARAGAKASAQAALARLATAEPALVPAFEHTLAGAGAAEPLHALLEAQAWRLAFWRVAGDEINYRRFFDINSLAALRMESRAVFEATQGLALELTASGVADGLRIDHPDGLRDPAGYFLRLQQGHARRAGLALPEAPGARPAWPLYLVVEKIAASHEDVPASWAVHGSTGYRFASLVNGLFVDPAAEARFDRIWRAFTGDPLPFEEHAYAGKRAVMRSALASELTVLASELLRIARADRRTRDHTFNSLRDALAEVTASLPVYRTYIVAAPSPQDRRYIEWAVAQARRRSRAADPSVFDFVRRTMLGEAGANAPEPLRRRALDWAVRFQQFSAPVAAKGVEDTAFYRHVRLAALNEVGGDPSRFGIGVRAFHGASADRAARWPHTLIATSTHDHKRSADVRCRIDVLSEMPAAWRLLLRRWSRMNRAHRTTTRGESPAPTPADEYLLYQTLLGTLPASGLDPTTLAAYRERITDYLLKAAREAKLRTSWTAPDAAYENALRGFVAGLLGRIAPNPFLDDLTAQARRLAWLGAFNSLATALLKFTSPGVPDIYQGHEVVNLTLVDPDNRKPVDYRALSAGLASLEALAPGRAGELVAAAHDGRAKLWIAWRLLDLRRRLPLVFRDGGYRPLKANGTRADHVVAFARDHAEGVVIVVVARLVAQLLGESEQAPCGAAVWADTAVAVDLADGTRLRNVLDEGVVAVVDGSILLADAFARFPGAALVVERA
ncbi:MAG: malto-oligosyltrehalose synthase [Caldimonas sp.]